MFNIPVKKKAGTKEGRFAVLKKEYRDSHKCRIRGKMFLVLKKNVFGTGQYTEVMTMVDRSNCLDYDFEVIVVKSSMLDAVEGSWKNNEAFDPNDYMPKLHHAPHFMTRELRRDKRFRSSNLPLVVKRLLDA